MYHKLIPLTKKGTLEVPHGIPSPRRCQYVPSYHTSQTPVNSRTNLTLRFVCIRPHKLNSLLNYSVVLYDYVTSMITISNTLHTIL